MHSDVVPGLDLITVYRDQESESNMNECTCDALQTPSLGEALFDHLEERRRKRGKSQLPADLLNFTKDMAMRPVQQGWHFSNLIESEPATFGANKAILNSQKLLDRRQQLKQAKIESVERQIKEDIDSML